jgi:hypothetical protein
MPNGFPQLRTLLAGEHRGRTEADDLRTLSLRLLAAKPPSPPAATPLTAAAASILPALVSRAELAKRNRETILRGPRAPRPCARDLLTDRTG